MPKYDVEAIVNGTSYMYGNVDQVIRTGDLPMGNEVITKNLEEGLIVYVTERADVLVVKALDES